jgi:hypothetical protein
MQCAHGQRQRERYAQLDIDAWDVKMMADEQWGCVLVAQRDFAPGEVVIRSATFLQAPARQHVSVCDDGSDAHGDAVLL